MNLFEYSLSCMFANYLQVHRMKLVGKMSAKSLLKFGMYAVCNWMRSGVFKHCRM